MTVERTQKQRGQRREPIPAFANREEEAHFWDTHDLADYWDEFTPVQVRFSSNLSEAITVRFDKESLDELRRQAHEKGLGPTTLARMWILERLKQAQ